MDQLRRLFEDERGIEGMPIRLVIALLVGVASLAIMMNMLGGIGPIGETEVDVEIDTNVIGTNSQNSGTDYSSTISVIDSEGNDVPGATVIITPETAQLTGTSVINEEDGDDDAEVDITFGGSHSAVDLREDQNKGTLAVEVVPPADSNYVDKKTNTEIIVVEGNAN